MSYKNIFFTLLFISFFISIVNSAADDEVSYCNINLNEESFSIMLMGFVISLLLVSIFYMYGKVMSSPEIEGTYMVELQQIGLTFIMLIFITAGVELLCSISLNKEGVLISSNENVFSSVKKSQLTLMKKTMDFYISIMDGINSYSILASTTAGITGKGISFTYSPLAEGGFITQSLAPVGQGVLIAYFAQVFQYSLFEFSRSKVFLLLLPIGIVLRSFPITRKFGGVLIALVLGLSYLYPLFLNFGYLFIDIDRIEFMNFPEPFAILIPLSAANAVLSILFSAIPEVPSAPVLIIIGLILGSEGLGAALGGVDVLEFLSSFALFGPAFHSSLYSIYTSFGTIMMGTFFIPALLIILVGAVVRSLSASIGTETDISGILRAV